jgi:hypothetical protein
MSFWGLAMPAVQQFRFTRPKQIRRGGTFPASVARTNHCQQKQKTTFKSMIVIVSETRAWLTKSLKLTENTACFSAARKKLFREMATLAARVVYYSFGGTSPQLSSHPLASNIHHYPKLIKS